MLVLVAAALLAGAPTESHRVEIDHRGRSVEAIYRGPVSLDHRQVGSIAGPGRPGTLRCAWSATVSVTREARSAAGHALIRTLAEEAPLRGSRPGWCATQRGAIAREIAARGVEIREHLATVAERDRAALHAELEAVHGPARG